MMFRSLIIVATLIGLLPSGLFADDTGQDGRKVLELCVEERNFYPFTFSEGRKGQGINVDIVRQALSSLGYKMVVTPFPLKRCLKMAEYGRIHGIISIFYEDRYADFLEYPPGASYDDESRWRIMQIDKVVVNSVEDDYEFNGDLSSLPEPVRIVDGDNIAEDLADNDVDLEVASSDYQNFAKLLRDGEGSVITTSIIADMMDRDPRFQDRTTVQAVPVSSISYFLVFTVEAPLTDQEKRRIWEEIVKWRRDYVFMLQVFARY